MTLGQGVRFQDQDIFTGLHEQPDTMPIDDTARQQRFARFQSNMQRLQRAQQGLHAATQAVQADLRMLMAGSGVQGVVHGDEHAVRSGSAAALLQHPREPSFSPPFPRYDTGVESPAHSPSSPFTSYGRAARSPTFPSYSPASPVPDTGPPDYVPALPWFRSASPVYSLQSPSHSPTSPVPETGEPYYVPASSRFGSASSVYTPQSPSYSPPSPVPRTRATDYVPASPNLHVASPAYSPHSPSYTPASPTLSSGIPVSMPSSPCFSPASPAYTPHPPSYTPTSPSNTPNHQSTSPTSPSYSPASPRYVAASPPAYSPSSPVLEARLSRYEPIQDGEHIQDVQAPIYQDTLAIPIEASYAPALAEAELGWLRSFQARYLPLGSSHNGGIDAASASLRTQHGVREQSREVFGFTRPGTSRVEAPGPFTNAEVMTAALDFLAQGNNAGLADLTRAEAEEVQQSFFGRAR